MIENTSLKSNTTVMEAPVSWNTRYTTPQGFVCQLTLRADTGIELLEKAQAAITHLLQTGCIPCDTMVFHPSINVHNTKAPRCQNGIDHPDNGNGNGNNHTRPIHGVTMLRWEENVRVWYSLKIGIFFT